MNRNAEAISAARARLALKLSPSLAGPLGEVSRLTDALRAKRCTLVGIASKAGSFAVTETRKEGRKYVTDHLTGWQSHAECVEHMRRMAA